MLILHVWFPSDGEEVREGGRWREGGGGREGRRGRDGEGGREVFCVVRFRSNILQRNRDVVHVLPCQ